MSTAATDGLTENTRGDTRPIKKAMKWAAWSAIGLFFLIFFTFLKLPEAKITNLIQGHLSNALAPLGITMAAEETSLSMIFGPRYRMRKVRIYLPPPARDIQVDEISFSPHVLSALFGRYGGTAWIRQGKSEASVSFSMHKNDFKFSFDASKLDLGKLQVLDAFAKLKGTAVVTGDGSGSGDLYNPSKLSGYLDLQIKDIAVEQQTLSGGGIPLSIPEIHVAESHISITAKSGSITFKTVQIGKMNSEKDDLRVNASGDATCGSTWYNSKLNLKVLLKPSERVMKAFLLDIVLGAYRQPDGSYNFMLSGPLTQPMPGPLAK